MPTYTLYSLPSGPLSMILNILMEIDPETLTSVVAMYGTRLPLLCHNNITLKLNTAWPGKTTGLKPTSPEFVDLPGLTPLA
jgi:hypothetical protein